MDEKTDKSFSFGLENADIRRGLGVDFEVEWLKLVWLKVLESGDLLIFTIGDNGASVASFCW